MHLAMGTKVTFALLQDIGDKAASVFAIVFSQAVAVQCARFKEQQISMCIN
jgi:hypothetical protein